VQVVISTAILLIATIIAASVFTAAALSELYTFQNTFKEVGTKNQAYYESSITIIGEAHASATSSSGSLDEIDVWVKNTGTTSFTISATGDPQYWDVFITFPNGTDTRFPYSSSCSVGQVLGSSSLCFNVALLNGSSGSSTWETGETVQLTIIMYNCGGSDTCTTLPTGAYQVSLSLSNGVTAQDSFSF
jgi:archaellum component FlaG (FlaF/FlaG flagellin family)